MIQDAYFVRMEKAVEEKMGLKPAENLKKIYFLILIQQKLKKF